MLFALKLRGRLGVKLSVNDRRASSAECQTLLACGATYSDDGKNCSEVVGDQTIDWKIKSTTLADVRQRNNSRLDHSFNTVKASGGSTFAGYSWEQAAVWCR